MGLLGVGGMGEERVWGKLGGRRVLDGRGRRKRRLQELREEGSHSSHQSLLEVSCWTGSWSWSGSRRRFRSNSTWGGSRGEKKYECVGNGDENMSLYSSYSIQL